MSDFLRSAVRFALAVLTAATEGFRVVRREPRAFLVWTLLWMLVLLVVATIMAFGPRVVLGGPAPRGDLLGLVSHFGVRAIVIVPVLVAGWAVTTTAICRAVFDPDHRAIFHLRFGVAELRVALIHTVTALVTPLIVALILGIGAIVARPFFEAAPTMAADIAAAGLLITVCLLVWLYVRLSLIPIETFAEGRIHVSAYWPVTRGHFWYLLWTYLAVLVIAAATSAVLGAPIMLLLQSGTAAIAQPASLLQRAQLLGAAAALSAASAFFFMIPTVLMSAAQAYAYRAIAGGRPGALEAEAIA
ncbi:MAG TPA: hypothetical protein VG939_01025 [Caulobacteraceae bacterium]|nr:hypothetical protein [Caulobacteraceae bacterium]